MVSEMNTTIKYMTNGAFYENAKPNKNTKSTCNLVLKNLILNTSTSNIIDDFYNPNLKLYVYSLSWTNTTQPVQCSVLNNEELAESARMILGENNTRELIDSNMPLCTWRIEDGLSKIHLLLFAITFKKSKEIIRDKLFDKIERIVKKSDLNKFVRQSSEREVQKIDNLIEKLRTDILQLSECIDQVEPLIYHQNIQANSTIISLENSLLNTEINILMNRNLLMNIPDSNGVKLIRKVTRNFKHLEEVAVPMSLGNSVSGDIEVILFALPATMAEGAREGYLNIIREFVKTAFNMHLIMVVEIDADKWDIEASEKQVERETQLLKAAIPSENNIKLKVVKRKVQRAEDSFSMWIQDALIPATTKEGKKYLLSPHSTREEKRNDGSIAKKVADSELGYHLHTFDMQLEGGNVLVADDFILVGMDEVLDNRMSKEGFQKKFKGYTGDERPVIFVEVPPKKYKKPKDVRFSERKERAIGEGLYMQKYHHTIYNWRGVRQPIYHLDVFMTPLGYDESGNYELLVGCPVAGFDYEAYDMENHIRKVFSYQLEDAQKRIDDCIERLKKTFTQQLKKSLKIHRNPMPLTFKQRGNNYNWYWATYNNCIIQNGMQKTVWLPTYGHGDEYNPHWNYLKQYDKENQKKFDELGFTPHLLNLDFHPFAEKNGSLHCLTKSILTT